MIPAHTPLIAAFRTWLMQLGYGKNRVHMLPRQVQSFLDYHCCLLEDYSQQHIESFYEWLHIRPNQRRAGGLSEAHIHYHMYALRLFFGWLQESGQLQTNPMNLLVFRQPQQVPRSPLTQQQVQQLFAATHTDRERALLHLHYSCGLRRSEAAALNSKDLHFKQRMLYVRSGKGCKRRAIPMTERVAKELESYWLGERQLPPLYTGNVKRDSDDQEAFMLNQSGSRMSGQRSLDLLKELLVRAALPATYTLHHLRHSIATHLLANGVRIEQVRDFLGHSYLDSTQLYAKVNNHQLKQL